MRTNDLELIKTVRSILVADNTDPNSPDELCIHSFVEDRIVLANTVQNISLPKITIDVVIEDNISNLPAENSLMYINVIYDKSENDAEVKCRMCSGRIVSLLDNRPGYLKTINANCIVRLIEKVSSVFNYVSDKDVIVGTISFNIIFKK